MGDDGTNHLAGGEGNDGLWGGAGDDMLEGGVGADRLFGGNGADWVSYQRSDTGVTVKLKEGIGKGGHAEGDAITGVENVRGSAHNDALVGGDGANYLTGSGGADGLWGGAGDDTLEGGVGADRLFGGAGADWVSYLRSDAGVTVNLEEGTGESGHAEGDTIVDVENVRGSAYADLLVGNDLANRLEGGDGNDVLRGSDDADVLNGGTGTDLLEGGSGADSLEGGAGVDTASYQGSDTGVVVRLMEGSGERGHAEGDSIVEVENVIGSTYNDGLVGDNGANYLAGGGGNDGLWGGTGDDTLEGGVGADRLFGGSGMDWATYQSSDAGVVVRLREGTGERGHAEGDTIDKVENVRGSAHNDALVGDDGANHLVGGRGADRLWGGAGDDTLEGSNGADRLFGGSGTDWTSYQGSDTGVTVRLKEGTGQGGHAEGDTIADVENVRGSAHNDALVGDDGANHLVGGRGADRLWGGAGSDTLEGGVGADRLFGGNGADWVSYLKSDAGVTVNLSDGTGKGGLAEGDVIADVENVQGSDYADLLVGNRRTNRLEGNDGDDVLRGNAGADVLNGGVGTDRLNGGAGADMLDGGAGVDWVLYLESDTGVTVNLGEGTGKRGHAEGDSIIEVENVWGSAYNDELIGDSSANRLEGANGDDELRETRAMTLLREIAALTHWKAARAPTV